MLKTYSCFSSIIAMTSEAWTDVPLLPDQQKQRLILQIKITWNNTEQYLKTKHKLTTYCCSCLEFMLLSIFPHSLTLILLMWRIWWASNNSSRWQIGFNSAFKGLKQVAVVVYICLSLWSCLLFIFFLMQSLVFGGMLTHSVCCLLLSFFLWSLFASQEFVPTLDSELPLNNSNAEVTEKKLIFVVCDSAFLLIYPVQTPFCVNV